MAFCVTVVVCGILCHGGSMWHMLDGCAQALSCRDSFVLFCF